MYFKHIFAWCMVALLAVSSLAAADLRLVDAARNRDTATVRSLLKQRIDVNAPETDGTTALHWAAHWGDLETAKLLIAAGANAKASNRYGVTPLHEASIIGDVAMMDTLLKAGASANATYGSGETPLMAAARSGNAEAVKVLLSHSADVNATEEFRGQTAVMWAAAENHAEIVKLLVDKGADVNAISTKYNFPEVKMAAGGGFMERADGGLTPLQFAARQGSIESAEILIAAGADVNAAEHFYGFTPMNTAIYNGHYDFAKMLIDKGANVNDGSLYLAIELNNMAYYTNRPNPPEVDRTLRAKDLIKILLDKGADPNAVFAKKVPQIQTQGTVSLTPGGTPLYRAIRSVDLETAKLLLEKGADASLATKDGTTPLMVAANFVATQGNDEEDTLEAAGKGNPLDAVKLLLDAGASVTAVNAQENTAVHLAAQRGNDKMVEFLVSKGAKLDVKNKAGKTPLDLAGKPDSKTATLIKKLMESAGSNSLQ